jgi:microcystin-dependent protein
MGGVNSLRLAGVFTSNVIGNSGGSSLITLTSDQMPSHTHTGVTNSAGNHAHPIGRGPNYGTFGVQGSQFIDNAGTTDFAGAHTHTFTTNPSGNNQAHPNVQPTLIMNKIIKVSY